VNISRIVSSLALYAGRRGHTSGAQTFLLSTALVLALAECGPGLPIPTNSSTSSNQPVAGPLTIALCGWPPNTRIAFQGWGTEADLGMMVASPTRERLYWLVTAEPVSLLTTQGTRMVRVACAVGREGLRSYRSVADDWEPPKPT
jgi:hypothetical protein